MADELKTDGQPITDPKGDETQVTISQEKLDSLINEKFKKGAEKANAKLLEELGVDSIDSVKDILKAKQEADEAAKSELEKLQEIAEAERTSKEALSQEINKLKSKNTLNEMAIKHGIKEADYFALELKKANVGENFNESEFIESLKESKPFIFGETKKVQTDTSGNTKDDPNDLGSKVANLSFKELQQLQANL